MPRSTPDPARLLPGSVTGLSPSPAGLPMPFPFIWQSFRQSIPRPVNRTVWAPPISLAATLGITLHFCFCFLFLRLLRCFSSPGSPHAPIKFPFFSTWYVRFPYVGSPIQTPADRRVFAPPRGFSQLIASFFGSQCQGIRPVPFFA